jgi:hypothetical protein
VWWRIGVAAACGLAIGAIVVAGEGMPILIMLPPALAATGTLWAFH